MVFAVLTPVSLVPGRGVGYGGGGDDEGHFSSVVVFCVP
jgi:hypothetical protein